MLSKLTNSKRANKNNDQLSSPVSYFMKLLTDYWGLRAPQDGRGGFSNNSCLIVGKPCHFSDPFFIVDKFEAVRLPLYALSLSLDFSLFGTSIGSFEKQIASGTTKS